MARARCRRRRVLPASGQGDRRAARRRPAPGPRKARGSNQLRRNGRQANLGHPVRRLDLACHNGGTGRLPQARPGSASVGRSAMMSSVMVAGRRRRRRRRRRGRAGRPRRRARVLITLDASAPGPCERESFGQVLERPPEFRRCSIWRSSWRLSRRARAIGHLLRAVNAGVGAPPEPSRVPPEAGRTRLPLQGI